MLRISELGLKNPQKSFRTLEWMWRSGSIQRHVRWSISWNSAMPFLISIEWTERVAF